MILPARTASLFGLLVGCAAVANSADGAIEILSPASKRSAYAQAVGVGSGPTVELPSLSTDSSANWESTSPTLSWDAPLNAFHSANSGSSVSTSDNEIDIYVNASNQLVMSIESMVHTRTAFAAQAGLYGNGAEGFYFKLTEATPFTLTSQYVATSESGLGLSTFETGLRSETSPFTSYFGISKQERGDQTYSLTASGTLPAGTYHWYQWARIVNGSDAGIRDEGGATGNGFFTLVLGNAGTPVDPGVVPEGASMAIWAGLSAIAGIGAWRMRA
jgi:hypothetical protein